MSDVTMTDEFEKSCTAFGWDLADMQWLTVNAMKSSFWPFQERLDLINNVIKPRYATLMGT
ncbi:MAG: adenosine deaminase, partial [Acidimicrobiales bacterium]|nr:adenosine deaminase [Acidimicrobiales bacterium]